MDKERMLFFEQQAEEAYSQMYEVSSLSDATARYSDAKEALHSAISVAEAIRDQEAVSRLEARLQHIKAVFRSQFC